eukprot:5420809-Amphidinium_carterae.4
MMRKQPCKPKKPKKGKAGKAPQQQKGGVVKDREPTLAGDAGQPARAGRKGFRYRGGIRWCSRSFSLGREHHGPSTFVRTCVLQKTDVALVLSLAPRMPKSNLFAYTVFPSWYAMRLGLVVWDAAVPYVRGMRTEEHFESMLSLYVVNASPHTLNKFPGLRL